MAIDISSIRKHYPVLNNVYGKKRIIYFDNACSVLKPQPVIDAIVEYYTKYSACAGGRSSHYLSAQVEERCHEAKDTVRRFINAENAGEIIWTKNTTEAINLVAGNLDYSGDRNEVITTDFEHHSNLLPFYEAERQGKARLKIFPLASDGLIDLEKFKKFVNKRTGLVSLFHSSNVLGTSLPIKEIADIVHNAGGLLMVDGSQYIPTRRADVRDLDVDFYAFSANKIGGPTGLGVLYAKKSVQKKIISCQVGGGTIKNVKINQGALEVNYLDGPAKFEAGTQHYSGMFGIKAAIDFVEEVSYENIAGQVGELTKYLQEKLSKIEAVKLAGPNAGHSLVSFYFSKPKYQAADFNLFLNDHIDDYFIAIRAGHHCAQPLHQRISAEAGTVRVSFYVYNDFWEIDLFIKALNEFINLCQP